MDFLSLLGCNRLKSIDYIVPVPLHPKKFKARGYNQLTTFGTSISEILEVPYIDNVLIKKSVTKILFGALLTLQCLIAQTVYCSAIGINCRASIGCKVSNAPSNFNHPSGIAVDHVTGDVFVYWFVAHVA